MRALAVQAFAEGERAARALAEALGAPFDPIDLHTFPDGEIMPTVPAPARTVVVHEPLDRPNEKLIRLLLAADAWRRSGVQRLVLVAPYLCYLRQDTVFAPGQPLSRDVLGGLLGPRFDRIVTVDAHLHRTADISGVFGGTRVDNLSAAPALAKAIGRIAPAPLLLGPDRESAPWVRALAAVLGGDSLVLRKTQIGDGKVEFEFGDLTLVEDRRVVIVDDVCSSGGTILGLAARLRKAGAAGIEFAVVHALFDEATRRRMAEAGVTRVISTDSVPHSTNAAPLAELLAAALQDEREQWA
jgi:ribose-phosphate pyrophosphokinase